MFRLAVLFLSSLLCASVSIAAIPARLDDEQIEKLLSRPIQLVTEGKLGEAQAAFENIAGASEPPSLRRADFDRLFGLSLVGLGLMTDDKLAGPGRNYLAQATAQYRRTVGNADPLVAQSLHLEFVSLDESEQEARGEPLLTEALAIQRRAGREGDGETVKLRLMLAALHARPERTKGDPRRIAAAVSEYEDVIKAAPLVMPRGDFAASGPAIRFELAALLLRNGQKDQARAQAIAARREIDHWPDEYRCAGIEMGMDDLEAGADASEWSNLRHQIVDASRTDCAIDMLPN